jgi:hypothetical protein
MADNRKMIEFDARLMGHDPRLYTLAPMSALVQVLMEVETQSPCAAPRATAISFPKGLSEKARDAQRRFILALYGQEGVGARGQIDMVLDVQNVADDIARAYSDRAAFCQEAAAALGVSSFAVIGRNAPQDAPVFVFGCDCQHFHAIYERQAQRVK